MKQKHLKHSTFALALCFSLTAWADGKLTGVVVDKTGAKPMDYVTVSVLSAGGGEATPLGTVTDERGEFVIENIPNGKYMVRFSCIGSITQEREVLFNDNNVNIGKIELAEDAKLLQEITITGQHSQMKNDDEKRVFNVASNIAQTGASAGELLAAVPSVSVDSDGKIALRGNDNVVVWINGKEMGMTADNRAQILRQISAEAVESIEVMTNPSAKYSTEGTAGIINIKLKEDHRHGVFGNGEAGVDERGSATANFNINYNEGRFETFAGLGMTYAHTPAGSMSHRSYDEGYALASDGEKKKHEKNVFLRFGTNYKVNDKSTLYLSAIGTLGSSWGHSLTLHNSSLPTGWLFNNNHMNEDGSSVGANALLGFKHEWAHGHHIDMNVSYNTWQSQTDGNLRDDEQWHDGTLATNQQRQHQDVKISNWEAAIDYEASLNDNLKLETGFKGNYNHENSPASYFHVDNQGVETFRPELYNRFKYDTDISALYLHLSGTYGAFSFTAGLRGEAWQIRTRSLNYGESDGNADMFKSNDFALFPSASVGWTSEKVGDIKLNYARRIRRPFGPQLNTFENIADPSEVHLGNPTIMPEYSDALELTYTKNWKSHTLSASAYYRKSSDMISHISFLAPMTANPTMNTMYYGHANVGNISNIGIELMSRNRLCRFLTLTTTANLYNSHLEAWNTAYPLHETLYAISSAGRDRLVYDLRSMASFTLPWDMALQLTGRYSSSRLEAQGIAHSDWDVEAGIRKTLGSWSFSLACKDLFDSKKTSITLFGNGYTQNVEKWTAGRTLRLTVSYSFGMTHEHDEHDDHDHKDTKHRDVDTGGYGAEHNHSH